MSATGSGEATNGAMSIGEEMSAPQPLSDEPAYSVVIPVYHEAENIGPLLRSLEQVVGCDGEILIVYDNDDDPTLPAIASLSPPPPPLRLVKNTRGPGVLNAIATGLRESRGYLGAVVMMADRSDDPVAIRRLVQGLRDGADVVAGSRYMKGGQQIGGPPLKRFLSRFAGLSAYWWTGIGIHDLTNSFRAYSRRLIGRERIESNAGFALAIEWTVKCHLAGGRVIETPVTWRDRSAGQSRFRLWAWLPTYAKWYGRLIARDLFGRASRRAKKEPARRNAGGSAPTDPLGELDATKLGTSTVESFNRPLAQAHYHYFGVYEHPTYGWHVRRTLTAVVIVPLTRNGGVVMIHIRRALGPDGEFWEVPGGSVDQGESLEEAARRELAEETGWRSQAPAEVLPTTFEPIPGMGRIPHRVVLLRDCLPGPFPRSAHDEGISAAQEMSPREVQSLVRAGEVIALPTLTALALAGLLETNV